MAMSTTEIFLVLGIEPTKEERLIKNAYREKLAVTNPEDNPEGFKRLRIAYEEACVYAKTAKEDEDAEKKDKDTTPSGLWVEQAEVLYADMRSRQDEKLWERLFSDDILWSLEEEENCRQKFLIFLMSHFRFPTNIWKIFDKKLHLVEGAASLRENFPADFVRFVINCCKRGEDFDFSLFEAKPDAEYDLFINYYEDCWCALAEKRNEEAERILTEAAGLKIYHPAMEVCRGRLLYQQGEEVRAQEFMKKLYARHPKDGMVLFNTAELLWQCNNREGAAEIYKVLQEEKKKHYMANVRLAEWYYEKGMYQEAKKCAEGVLSLGADDTFMELLVKINKELEQELERKWKEEHSLEAGMELGWCYLQDGKNSRGIRLTKELAKVVPEEKLREYYGLVAKLSIEQGDFTEAIRVSEIWEELLRKQIPLDENVEEREKNEDRVRQAQMIRIQCYKVLGYRDKKFLKNAIDLIELAQEETSENTPDDIGFLLEKACIYVKMEEYERALEITERLIGEYQMYAAAATAMDAYSRQWQAGGVVQNARLCIEKFPTYVKAYEQLGKVYLDLKEKERLREVLELAEKNNVKSSVLEAYRYQIEHEVPSVEVLNQKLEEFDKQYGDRLEEGEVACYEQGLPLITEYLYWYPGNYMLRKRAVFHVDAEQPGKALADLEEALLDEPEDPYVYNLMSAVYRVMGDYEKALVCMKKCIAFGEEEFCNSRYYYLARIYMLLEDEEQALYWLEQYEQASAGKTNHLKCMYECLARLGRVEEAVEKAKLLYKDGNPVQNGFYYALSEIYRMAGKYEEGMRRNMEWSKKLLVSGMNPFLAAKNQNRQEAVTDYCSAMAWYALVCGKKQEALKFFVRQVRSGQKRYGNHSDEGLEDTVFAAILWGEKQIGEKYAMLLRKHMEQAKKRPVDEYLKRPKGRLVREFLANYYIWPEEKLEALLKRETECNVCDFCLMPLCKEMEAMRILFLLRQGKKEEAKNRLVHNLKIQPYDEYMQAIAAVLQ